MMPGNTEKENNAIEELIIIYDAMKAMMGKVANQSIILLYCAILLITV